MSTEISNEYIESEKIWCGPTLELNFPNRGLGQVILSKLKETDPKRVIEVEHESGASLSAGELRSQTITVAQNLMRLGVKKGDVVIVYSKSNIKITPITFALYTIGAPVNFFYLDLKGDAIKHNFEKLDPTVILYEEEFVDEVFPALENLKLSKLKHVLSLDSKNISVDEVLFRPTSDIESFIPPNIENPDELPAVLPFTSGSTGMPKIAMQSHSMMLLGNFNTWWKMEPKSVVALATLADLRWMVEIGVMLLPVFFDVIRIHSSKREKDFDDAYEYELLHKNKVTHYVSVPILHVQLLKNAVESNNSSKLSHLKTIWLGGEVVTDSLIEYSAKIIPNCDIVSCYAMSEIHGKIASDDESGKMVNGGLLENEFMAKIIDEDGNALGPNEKGRLCLKSKVPILGYFKDEEANRDHFRGDGWFTTEEYAYMDSEHLLNVVTRYKYLLRYNGEFVNPTGIENVINDHPNVLTSALVGYPDPERKNSEVGTVFVILRNDAKRDIVENELAALVRENLTNEQAKLVRFLKVIDEMPMCNFCKINRTALKEMAAIESVSYLRL